MPEPLHINLLLATLPPGDDPDSFVRREGADAMRAIIDAAKPWYSWVFDRTVEACRVRGDTVEARAEAVRLLVPVVKSMRDVVTRTHYRRRLAELGEIDEADVRALIGDRPAARKPPRSRGGMAL